MNEQSLQSPLSILFVTDHPEDGASSRFRIYQFLPILERHNIRCHVAPFTSKELYGLIHKRGHHIEKLIRAIACLLRRFGNLATSRRYDLVFLHREAFPFGPPIGELLFSSLSRCLVFDFDDALDVGHIGTNGFPISRLYKLKYGRQTYRVISAADLVVAGNRILADYARRFNRCVEVVPTVIDTEKYSYREPQSRTSPVIVGWMGSPSTSPYLDLLKNVFRELKARHGNHFRLAFYGDPSYQPPIEDAVIEPFSLKAEMEQFRTLDIGIMPLPDNEWTRGKCAFKAIQYMSLGIPAVCSPVGVTSDLITHCEDGFLARSEADWVLRLSALIQSAGLRREIAAKARLRIQNYYSLNAWAPKLVKLLRQTASGPEIGENTP